MKKAEWLVLVQPKASVVDHRGKALEGEWKALGLPALKRLRVGAVYELEGTLSELDARALGERLLSDPLVDEALVVRGESLVAAPDRRRALVWPKEGVSDPVADTVKEAASDLNFRGVDAARSGQLYEFVGRATRGQVERFCENVLMNTLVQRVDVL